MGSQAIQGQLWGHRPEDWAIIQEKTARSGYDYVLDFLNLNNSIKLLDIGCGSGLFCDLAHSKETHVTGLDASDKLIEQAKIRNPSVNFMVGEMEEIPFESKAFDIVCGFNSFQYASSIKDALIEAKRVLKDKGKLVAMIWGNKEECEVAGYMKALGSLLPPPPPGAPGPFALSENKLLERLLEEAGLRIIDNIDIESIWDYQDDETAVKGLMSAGTVSRAIETSGLEQVIETISEVVKPYTQPNGHVVYRNKFRILISEN
ncbi:MAG: class I SAM-dependent methyltransferase [Cyclobacteriaceae bacterium]|nr:class I SAM-dependent methyltransferase [Cyclobacteriaceae bacterium]